MWGLFFGTLLLGWERLPNSDFSGQFEAFARHQAREMLAGRLPLWSEGSFGGVPFVADVQAAVFYPPRWLTVLFSAPWGMGYYALTLEALLHVWLTGAFTYLLAFDITQKRPAALLAAVSFGLGGYLTSYPILQLAILETWTWLPLALLWVRCAVQGENWTRPLVGVGLTLALALAAGHPQTFVHGAYVVAFYYLFCAWQGGWRVAQVVGRGVVVGAVGMAASTAVWLPALVYLPLTVRAEASYDYVSGGQALLNYAQLLMPEMLTFWTPEYVGMGALLGAVITITKKERRAERVFWTAVAGLALWLSLGDKGILFEAWYAVAPGFGLFRQQERLVGVVSLAVAMLGALGVVVATAQAEKQAIKQGVVAVGVALLGVPILFGAAAHLVADGWLAVWGRQVALLGMCAGLLWLGRRYPLVLWGLALLAAGDLYVSTQSSINRTAESPSVFWPHPAWVDVMQADPELGRFDPGFLFFVNFGEEYKVATVRGISPLKPQVLADMERLPLGRLWPLLNVTHGLFQGEVPADVPATAVAQVTESVIPGEERVATLYRLDGEVAQARAWLSTQPVVVPDQAAALEAIAQPEFDPAREVVLLADEAGMYAVGGEGSGAVVVEIPHDGLVRVRVNTAVPVYLVISEWHMPGWVATLNGERVPLLKANYGLQAVFVPAGEQVVAVRFRPWFVWLGGLVSVLAVIGAGAFSIWECYGGMANRGSSPESRYAESRL